MRILNDLKANSMRKLITSLTIATLFILSTSCDKDCPRIGRCNLEPDPGPCKGLAIKFYFDKKDKKCKEFGWGLCEGVVPFDTLEECENRCDCI